MISGGRPDGPGLPEEALLALAQREGVVSLVAECLSGWGDAPHAALFTAASQRSAALAMLRHQECRRLLDFLREKDIPTLLLKGSALGWWLYPSAHLRECSDIDLLLPSRAHADELARQLPALGYGEGYTQGAHAYERVCRKRLSPTLQLDLDLHWGLNNAPVFARVPPAEALWAEAIALPRLASNARGLAPHHALLHASMHRAINLYTRQGDRLKWLYDVHLLARQMSAEGWAAVESACRDHHLAGMLLSALDAAADVFGQAAPPDVLATLRAIPLGTGVDGARLGDWHYMHRMNLRALPSVRARAGWLARKLLPEVGHMREMYGAQRSLAGLWWARASMLLRRLG